MLYLLDANVVIRAAHEYYPLDAVPEFWDWLAHQAAAGFVKMPLETFEEVKDGGDDVEKDLLFAWIQENKEVLIFDEEADLDNVRDVVEIGYAADLTEDEIEQLGRDPFLIAYALADPANRTVVTTEVSKPKKQRQNRKVPDVCATMGVTPCHTFKMLRDLGFKTNWKDGL